MQLFDILQMSNSRKCIERRLAVGNVRYLVSGDCAVTVEFGNEISPEINRKIRAFKIALEKEQIEGIVETVPTYRSLLVVYKPEVIRFSALTEKFEKILSSMGSIQIPPPTVIEIPVLYGGEMGPDLANVAEHNGLTEEEVVKIHCGSVGIAGEQTGIYPVASPGGWQLIGRTPLKLYDSEREKPVLLESGQYIKFRPVTEEEYKAIEKQVENDTYQYVVYDKEAE